MDFSARKVNRQLGFVKDLFRTIAHDGSLKDAALLQSCYLLLELAVLFYLAEVAATKKHLVGDDLALHTLDEFIRATNSLLKNTPEVRELVELSSIDDSWLSVLIEQLGVIRTTSIALGKKDGLQGELFVTVEAPVEEEASNLIAVANVDRADVSGDFSDFERLISDFQELVTRQRANNEEY